MFSQICRSRGCLELPDACPLDVRIQDIDLDILMGERADPLSSRIFCLRCHHVRAVPGVPCTFPIGYTEALKIMECHLSCRLYGAFTSPCDRCPSSRVMYSSSKPIKPVNYGALPVGLQGKAPAGLAMYLALLFLDLPEPGCGRLLMDSKSRYSRP